MAKRKTTEHRLDVCVACKERYPDYRLGDCSHIAHKRCIRRLQRWIVHGTSSKKLECDKCVKHLYETLSDAEKMYVSMCVSSVTDKCLYNEGTKQKSKRRI